MSRENGSEPTQRTVAELLAQYGGSATDATPRRRRRRADDPTDTAPQAIIQRVLSDSGKLPQISDDALEQTSVAGPLPLDAHPSTPRTTHRRPGQQSGQYPVVARQEAKPATGRTPPPRIESSRTDISRPDLQPGPRSRQAPPPVSHPPSGYYRMPGGSVDNIGDTTQHRPVTPEYPPRPMTSGAMQVPPAAPEMYTEQLPRVVDEPPPGLSVRSRARRQEAAAESTQAHPGPLLDTGEHAYGYPDPYADEDDGYEEVAYAEDGYDYPDDSLAAPAGIAPGSDEDVELAQFDERDEFEDQVEFDEEDEGEGADEGSPVRQWLMMAVQLGAGLVGGAALWLGFQWLWNVLPAAALVVAVAVIVGLVVVVRRIRKADDLQTMVLAVLVGLIVTVSPAALRLVGH